MEVRSLGIIGAGKLGMVLARLALKAGYKVYVSGSGDPGKIKLIVDTIAPGAIAVTTEELARQADVIILAVPLSKFRAIPPERLNGKIVIDATNYWWEVDGLREEILPEGLSSSEAVQAYFADATVIKALSHMGYHHLYDETRPSGVPGRKAIAVAGDDDKSVAVVSVIVDQLGFDPVVIGALARGRRLEPGSPAFGANEDAERLRRLVEN